MKIAMAADHAGYELKNAVKAHLLERGIEITDLGVNSPDPVDYPVYGAMCARYVVSGAVDLGIVCCGSGTGIAMAANKVKGARCAVVYSEYTAEMCKRHNNANMVSFGGRVTAPEEAVKYIDIWLSTEFSGERHQRRIDLLNSL